jgi:hypothetical protein
LIAAIIMKYEKFPIASLKNEGAPVAATAECG